MIRLVVKMTENVVVVFVVVDVFVIFIYCRFASQPLIY